MYNELSTGRPLPRGPGVCVCVGHLGWVKEFGLFFFFCLVVVVVVVFFWHAGPQPSISRPCSGSVPLLSAFSSLRRHLPQYLPPRRSKKKDEKRKKSRVQLVDRMMKKARAHARGVSWLLGSESGSFFLPNSNSPFRNSVSKSLRCGRCAVAQAP